MNSPAVISGTYDERLVVLSVLIAIFASYTALDLTGRVVASRGSARLAWLSGGAVAMGSGIWSMHYTGMLAFRLPMTVYYHIPTVALSLLAAIVASAIALFVVSRIRVTAFHVAAGGLLMGSGIATMHYTGMAAMRLRAMHHYHPALLLLSIVLAIVIAFAALALTYYFRNENRGRKVQVAIALVMGLAIPTMHYTGMAAVSFMPSTEQPDLSNAMDISALASSAVILVTLVILGFAVLTSVVDRRLSAQARELEFSKQRYQLLFESNPAPVFVFHLKTLLFLAANQAAVETYHFSVEDFLKLTLTTLHVSEDLDSLLREGGASQNVYEAQHRRKDGTLIDVELRMCRIAWDGKPAALLLVHDITERRQAERQRDLMEVQLRHSQKLESIGQLAAGIAHEINTPTQYVGNNVRFLQEAFADLRTLMVEYDRLLTAAKGEALSREALQQIVIAAERADTTYLLEEVPKAIQQTLEGVERIRTLVAAMKEFSHPGSKEKTPLNLNKAIESTLTVARSEWKYLADLETDYDSSLPLVSCLASEFNQAILNLIVNAAHAIADVVGTGGSGKGKIRVQTRDCPDCVEIRIADTGSGIPEKVRPRIFDPFFTTKAVGRGTGQGLAIVRSVVVDKHQGSIHFETEEGKGTTFIIRLPHDGKALPSSLALV
jgi:PAS domain S-box-containing protein